MLQHGENSNLKSKMLTELVLRLQSAEVGWRDLLLASVIIILNDSVKLMLDSQNNIVD
jgi:hypothetical protein